MFKKFICLIKCHRRGRTIYGGKDQIGRSIWTVKCERCGYKLRYVTPHVRSVAFEMRNGFDGN